MFLSTLTTILFALAAPCTANAAPAPAAMQSVQPSAIIIYQQDAQNTCNPAAGIISLVNGAQPTSSLVTFTYPPAVSGKMCYLAFPLAASTQLSGSMQTDIFRTWSPVNSCPSSGNHRDVQLGRMNLVAGGAATWAWTSNAYLTQPTACPAPGTVETLEFAPVSGSTGYDSVIWVQGAASGPIVYYY